MAVEFARVRSCRQTSASLNRTIIGFDLNQSRIKQLTSGFDKTLEISSDDLESASPTLVFTSSLKSAINSDVYIVTVPPIDEAKARFETLATACEMLGKLFLDRDIHACPPVVVFESTVYPGATEEVCPSN